MAISDKNDDSVKMFNQPVAQEGILPYENADGTIALKLKKWEHLKKNIGRKVPVVNEHPDENNGKGGLVNKEHIYGDTILTKCPNKKMLCMNPIMEDGAPIKKGYSIGFIFAPDKNGGIFKGKKFDEVQSDLLIDHIALTNSPRSQHAVMVTGDSVTSVTSSGNNTVNKYYVGYDSFNTFINYQVDKMPHNESEIRAKLKKDNPDIDDAELEKRVAQISKNEKDQEEEEEKKKKNADALLAKLTQKELVAEVARLRAESDSKKFSNQRIKEIEAERDSYKISADKYKDQITEILQKQVKINIDSLIKDYNCDEKDFDKKNASFIEGAKWYADKVNLKNVPGTPPKKGEFDSDVQLSINDYRYNRDTKKMEYQGGK